MFVFLKGKFAWQKWRPWSLNSLSSPNPRSLIMGVQKYAPSMLLYSDYLETCGKKMCHLVIQSIPLKRSTRFFIFYLFFMNRYLSSFFPLNLERYFKMASIQRATIGTVFQKWLYLPSKVYKMCIPASVSQCQVSHKGRQWIPFFQIPSWI